MSSYCRIWFSPVLSQWPRDELIKTAVGDRKPLFPSELRQTANRLYKLTMRYEKLRILMPLVLTRAILMKMNAEDVDIPKT